MHRGAVRRVRSFRFDLGHTFGSDPFGHLLVDELLGLVLWQWFGGRAGRLVEGSGYDRPPPEQGVADAANAVEGPRAGARARTGSRRAGKGPGAGMTDNLKFYFMWPVGS